MEDKKNILILCQVKFWQRDSGSCMILEKGIREFPADKKYLALTFRVSKKLRKKLADEYQLTRVFCLISPKTIFIRMLRGVFFVLHIKCPYFLLKPFRFSKIEKEKFRKKCQKLDVSILQVEYIWYSDLASEVIKKTNILTIIETHDIQSSFTSCLMEMYGRVKNFVTVQEEIQIYNRFDAVLALSTSDYRYYKKVCKTNVFYVPPFTFDQNFSFLQKKQHKDLNIGYIAGSSDFNLSSILWFINNVFHNLKNGTCRLNVYGKIGESLRKKSLAGNIIIHGYVPNVREVYEQNDIMINTTFQAGGIKIKNLEALSYSTPILTTPMGIRGLEGAIKYHAAFVGNKPDEFRKIISFLLMNPKEITKSAYGAYLFIKENFSSSIYSEYYQNLFRLKNHEN